MEDLRLKLELFIVLVTLSLQSLPSLLSEESAALCLLHLSSACVCRQVMRRGEKNGVKNGVGRKCVCVGGRGWATEGKEY